MKRACSLRCTEMGDLGLTAVLRGVGREGAKRARSRLDRSALAVRGPAKMAEDLRAWAMEAAGTRLNFMLAKDGWRAGVLRPLRGDPAQDPTLRV